jgi:hypothetical protein
MEAIAVPFKFVCSSCGKTLLETEDLRCRYDSPPPPIEGFIKKYVGESCPYCGHKLHIPPLKIEVFPIKEKRKPLLEDALAQSTVTVHVQKRK